MRTIIYKFPSFGRSKSCCGKGLAGSRSCHGLTRDSFRTFKTDSNGSITLSLPPPMSTPEREAREAEEEKIVPEISAEEDELSSGRRRQRSVDEESAESFSNDEEDADQTKKTGEDSATENGGIKDYESALFSPKAEDITGRDEEIQSLAAALHESLISGGGDLGPRREGNSGQKDMPVDLLIKEEATPKEAVKKEGNLGVADAGDLAGVSSLSPRTVKKMRLARRSLGPSSSRTYNLVACPPASYSNIFILQR